MLTKYIRHTIILKIKEENKRHLFNFAILASYSAWYYSKI